MADTRRSMELNNNVQDNPWPGCETGIPGMDAGPSRPSGIHKRHSYPGRQSYMLMERNSAGAGMPRMSDKEYNHPVKVEMRATFMKITDIDTISQQFEAEVFIQAKWEELSYIGYSLEELDKLQPWDLWDPEIVVTNTMGEFEQERRSYTVRYEEGFEAPVVLFRWRFKGIFRESLELEHFPFDVQDIGLRLSSERSVDEIILVHDPWHLSSVNTNLFQDSQEWSIYKHVEVVHDKTSMEYASSSSHPILFFKCRVRRKVGYFVWNIIFTVALILILSFTTISIDPTLSDRLVSTITLFLTLVAFKLVVKQSLPTISYLTYLDVYVVGSLLYLVLYSIENALIASKQFSTNRDLLFIYDELAVISLGALLILFHLLFVIYIQITALKRRRMMSELDKKYDERMQHLMMQKYKKKHAQKTGRAVSP